MTYLSLHLTTVSHCFPTRWSADHWTYADCVFPSAGSGLDSILWPPQEHGGYVGSLSSGRCTSDATEKIWRNTKDIQGSVVYVWWYLYNLIYKWLKVYFFLIMMILMLLLLMPTTSADLVRKQLVWWVHTVVTQCMMLYTCWTPDGQVPQVLFHFFVLVKAFLCFALFYCTLL